MKEIKDLNELDVEQVEEFRHEWYVYRNDFRLKTYFNKILGIDLKRAYCTDKIHANNGSLDWGGKHIILAFKNGNFVKMTSSEWAWFEFIKAEK